MGRRTRAIQSVAEIGGPGERKREGGRALITQLASTLQGEINPSTIAATVPSPLKAGWRRTDGMSYFFVLNISNTQVNGASVALTGVGLQQAQRCSTSRRVRWPYRQGNSRTTSPPTRYTSMSCNDCISRTHALDVY